MSGFAFFAGGIAVMLLAWKLSIARYLLLIIAFNVCLWGIRTKAHEGVQECVTEVRRAAEVAMFCEAQLDRCFKNLDEAGAREPAFNL